MSGKVPCLITTLYQAEIQRLYHYWETGFQLGCLMINWQKKSQRVTGPGLLMATSPANVCVNAHTDVQSFRTSGNAASALGFRNTGTGKQQATGNRTPCRSLHFPSPVSHRVGLRERYQTVILCPSLTRQTKINLTFQRKLIKASQISK